MLRVLCCLVALIVVNAEVLVKNMAGPPSEFGSMQLPSPLSSADVQNSATFSVDLIPDAEDASVLSQHVTLTVDSTNQFRFVFYSPFNQSVTLKLKNPKGNGKLLVGKKTYFPIGDDHSVTVAGTEYTFSNPQVGAYQLIITSKPSMTDAIRNKILTNTESDALIMLWNEDALATHTALNTYTLLTGSQIGLVSRVFTESFSARDLLAGMVPTALNNSVTAAEMNVILPDGESIYEPMQDDGLHEDGAANDGVYGGLIKAPSAGNYIFSATISGTNNGVEYIRTTQQFVTVVDTTVTLTGLAVGTLDSSATRMNVLIGVTGTTGDQYRAYAEVWGTDAAGNVVPVAWIGGMTFVQDNSVMLELDLNWLSMAGAEEPLVLKNVLLQDTDAFIPISQSPMIPVKTSGDLAAHMATLDLIDRDGEITNEMLEGRRPEKFFANNVAASVANLALVHGYCTTANPFEKYAEDWTKPNFFKAFSKNWSHDEFAKAVLAWSASLGPFSYVGHSQGGAVGVHIKNFYWSGLDQVTGGRVLQSVGTPYQGSSGAGSAANLAKLFGVLCGANTDLSRDGAGRWLSAIATNRTTTAGSVTYYTTTYKQGKFFGDYCNLATNLVLSFPNDGVTEYEYGQLPGGNNGGNVEGWCHSVDMKYSAQCEDRTRNKQMNSLAARNTK